MCRCKSPILREPPRWERGTGAEVEEEEEEMEVVVPLRVGLGEGVFRPPRSTGLKHIHSPLTLLQRERYSV